jgi:hypothetical protein
MRMSARESSNANSRGSRSFGETSTISVFASAARRPHCLAVGPSTLCAAHRHRRANGYPPRPWLPRGSSSQARNIECQVSVYVLARQANRFGRRPNSVSRRNAESVTRSIRGEATPEAAGGTPVTSDPYTTGVSLPTAMAPRSALNDAESSWLGLAEHRASGLTCSRWRRSTHRWLLPFTSTPA